MNAPGGGGWHIIRRVIIGTSAFQHPSTAEGTPADPEDWEGRAKAKLTKHKPKPKEKSVTIKLPEKKEEIKEEKAPDLEEAVPAESKTSIQEDEKNKGVIGVAIGACILITTGLGLLIPLVAVLGASDCERYADALSTGDETSDLSLSPVEISDCRSGGCTFDVASCSEDCPFGYEMDDDKRCPIGCECALEGVMQGDISFDNAHIGNMLSQFGYVKDEEFSLFYGTSSDIWDIFEADGRFQVPYALEAGLDASLVDTFERSIKNMSEHICIDFIPRTNENQYLEIVRDTGGSCTASIGRGGDIDTINLPLGCFFESTIQHELMHALGFHHEQSRPDRDAYVDIFLDNVKEQNYYDFDKVEPNVVKVLGSEYELKSAMHFQSYAYAVDKSKPTITGKGDVIINHPTEKLYLTEEDYREINLLYGCADMEPEKNGSWSDWGAWSECGVTCGGGNKKRFRECLEQETGEKLLSGCPDSAVNLELCVLDECPKVVAGWSEWSLWKPCSKTCGLGVRVKRRTCSSSKQGGCSGDYWKVEECIEADCETGKPVVLKELASWSQWHMWTACDVTCGEGKRERMRECAVDKMKVEIKNCEAKEMDGEVDEHWQRQKQACHSWFTCQSPQKTTTTMGPKFFTTTSTNPLQPTTLLFQPPATILKFSNDTEKGGVITSKTATTTEAPKGEWGVWGPWGQCDQTCGPGRRKRERICISWYCGGSHCEEEECGTQECEHEVVFSEKPASTGLICLYGTLLVGKFNDDKADDLVCVFPDAFVMVYSSSPGDPSPIPNYVTWEGQVAGYFFGVEDNQPDISLGDVNGDQLDDLISFNRVTKQVEITLNGPAGFSKAIGWKGSRQDCDVVTFQEVTGDNKLDMICGTSGNAFKYIFPNSLGG